MSEIKTQVATVVVDTPPKNALKPVKPREPWVERILDLFAGWLLAASMCMVVDAQFRLLPSAGFFTVLWHTAVVMLVMTLLTLRWWLLPSVIGVGAVTTFFLLLPWDRLVDTVETVKQFFLWWFSNMPVDSPWNTPQNMYIVHSLIHLAVTVLVFVLLRICRRSWPLVVLGGALQAFVILAAYKDNSTLSFGLYVSGVFPLLARDRYSGQRMFSRKRRYDMSVPRWKTSTASAVLCILLSVALFFAMPANTSELRLRFCSDIVSDMQTSADWYLEDQVTNTTVTLHALGLQPNEYRLGGSLEEIPSKILATTNLTEETLVKITSFDTFTGKNWTNEFETVYRVNAHWTDKQAEAFASDTVMDKKWQSALAQVGEFKEITFTTTAPLFLLPTVGQTYGVTENTYAKSTLSFNSRGDLLTLTHPMPVGYTYTVKTLDIPLENALERPAYAGVTSIAMSKRDELLWNDAFYKHYTAIPDNISSDAIDIANDVATGAPTKLQQVIMLSRYFSLEADYEYVEDCGKTDYNDNVVDQVLRTQQGHCVHYATAMAMMTRGIGIPTRLAAGYRTVADETGKQVVDASEPYVWVECYFDNFGWLPFDPTPGDSFDIKLDNMPNLEEEDKNPPPMVENEQEDEPPPPKKPKTDTSFLWWLIPVILLGLLLIVAVVHTCLSPRNYRLAVVRKRYSVNRQQAQHYYQDILRQLKLLGHPLVGGDTLYELLTRFTDASRKQPPDYDKQLERHYRQVLRQAGADSESTVTLREALQRGVPQPSDTPEVVKDIHARLLPLIELHYAGMEPTDQQIESLEELHNDLEQALRAKLPLPVYILRRRMLLPPVSRVTKLYKKLANIPFV